MPIDETKIYSKEDVQEPERKLSVGTVVGNKFKIVTELGGGGMGIILEPDRIQ